MAVAIALAVAACQPAPGAHRPLGPAPSSAERNYTRPPELGSAVHEAGGRLLLSGVAPALSRVRLASPTGDAAYTIAGKDGTWRIAVPLSADLRLFGLSASTAGRAIQSEGYLAVAPNGEAAQLRSGSGASTLVSANKRVSLLAADFDRKGGTVLSGAAPSGAAVRVLVDDHPRGVAKSDRGGRFLLALNEPLTAGPHSISIQSGGEAASATLDVSPPVRPASGPFTAHSVEGGWRIDWLTPGGGMQSTVLFKNPAGPQT